MKYYIDINKIIFGGIIMIYVFFAEGFEEIEALTPVDLLRRAELQVKTVGINGQIINSNHGVPVFTDITENEVVLSEDLEMIVLPGGMPGTLNLEKSKTVQDAIDYCIKNNILIGAICAAPSILGHKGILDNKKAICFPGFENQMGQAILSDTHICIDSNIITAKGAGVALEFSLKLVECIKGEKSAKVLKGALQCK